jgi:ferredoxin
MALTCLHGRELHNAHDLRDTAMPTPRLPSIDPERCTGCGRCVAACAPRVLVLEAVRWEKFAALQDAQRCTGCSECAVICPFRAITMRKPPQ